MEIREIENQPPQYNLLATHPLQSWEWGEFRKKTGIRVFRFGEYRNNKLMNIFQLTLHKLPKLPFYIGYIPKSVLPSAELLNYLSVFAKINRIIFVKFEPNIEKVTDIKKQITEKGLIIGKYELVNSPRPLFTKYTFQIDLSLSEEELLARMKSKSRYNLRLAQKKGVKVVEDNSDKSFDEYLSLQKETWKRQKFFAHTEKYHRLLWKTLKPAGLAHIFNAKFEDTTLTSWMLFLFNNALYYPYGGSSDKMRNLMASNLILWETALWGKKNGATLFDLWGALGPEPDPNDPWYGFHRFKEGYGGRLVEFIGSFDFVINPNLYGLYNLADNLRWKILHMLQ